MEEGPERDSSSGERHSIDDDDMEDSLTDSQDIWNPERNEADTMFERALGDDIPTRNTRRQCRNFRLQRKKFFKDLVKGGNETH
jgi:hypothetical protein